MTTSINEELIENIQPEMATGNEITTVKNTNDKEIKRIVEALLMASRDTLSIKQIIKLFEDETSITIEQIKNILEELTAEYAGKGIELKELAGGYRFQICSDISPWINKLFEERPPRYSRALLETLAIIAYKQPVTRAEIENIRGVSISASTLKTILDRDWVKIVGYKNVPGKPALYGSTKQFLDYFNLKSLKELPELEQIINEKKINEQLELNLIPEIETEATAKTASEFEILDPIPNTTQTSQEEIQDPIT
jgi:segregation and condensation protein B